jgi:hypothetical protein
MAMTILYWGIGATVSLLGGWAGYTVFSEGRLDQPTYAVTEKMTVGEVRQYIPFIIARTQPSVAGDPGLSEGFRTLAGYIFGGNTPNEKLSMTAPVLQQNVPGESLPMTAPVLSGSTEMMMAFVMPIDRKMADLPAPNSGDISLQEVDLGLVAAVRFSGRGKQATFAAQEARLRAEVKARGLQPSADALYAQYNSPFAFPLLRRNEVLIPLTPPAP